MGYQLNVRTDEVKKVTVEEHLKAIHCKFGDTCGTVFQAEQDFELFFFDCLDDLNRFRRDYYKNY